MRRFGRPASEPAPRVVLTIFGESKGRATVWRIKCSAKKCGGVAPLEFASKAAAIEGAMNHRENTHSGVGILKAPARGRDAPRRRRAS